MKYSTAAILFLVVPSLASAGEIYGKITMNGSAVTDGASLSATCGAKNYPAVTADKTGSYHLVVAESGKCALTVTYKGASAKVDVVSYEDGVQADIVLEMKGAALSARRK